MKFIPTMSLLMILLTACSAAGTATTPAPIVDATIPPADELISNVDILANLPEPDCSGGLTPADQEGPYFKTGSPETTSLFTQGMPGKRLILTGTVVDENCLPIPGATLDFWQTDANGEYDNSGYTLRAHQSSDNKGRYYLDTVLPGIYESRPIRHIHVKVTSPGGKELTSQLYFPEQPVSGQTVQLEDRGGYLLAIFNFVMQK